MMALSSETEEGFSCGICFEEYQPEGDLRPKLLPCSHTLCLKCLQKLPIKNNKISCPECNQKMGFPADGVSNFSTNRYTLESQRLIQEKENLKNGNKTLMKENEKLIEENRQLAKTSDKLTEENKQLMERNQKITKETENFAQEKKSIARQHKQTAKKLDEENQNLLTKYYLLEKDNHRLNKEKEKLAQAKERLATRNAELQNIMDGNSPRPVSRYKF